MKIKMDHYDLNILANGLYTMRDRYDPETKNRIYDLLLRLIEIHENMNPNRRTRIILDNSEHRIILRCLIDWRNQLLREEKPSAAECVGELILLISG